MLQIVFATNIFLSAFLIFLVQPMLAKSLLPAFGGSAFVWVTSILFFQFGLLVGYVYAHYLCKLRKVGHQVIIHLLVIGLSFLFLPLNSVEITWMSSWWPPLAVLSLLFISVFVPFALLSSSSPLFQYWYCHIKNIEFPYYFYAISNAGSLIGLLCYPFMVEYLLGLSTQKSLWSISFIIYVGLSLFCLLCYFLKNQQKKLDTSDQEHELPVKKQVASWLFYSFLSCSLLLSMTQYLSQNVLNLPLLWVMPLVLYLISFIVTFRQAKQYNFAFWGSSWLIWCALLLGLFLFLPASPIDIVVVSLILMFSGCMVCHGELVNAAPRWHYLTDFYLIIALGGVLGGIFINLISVWLFDTWMEFYIIIFLVSLIVYYRYKHPLQYFEERKDKGILKLSLPLLALFSIGISYIIVTQFLNEVVYVRNPYGFIQVQEENFGDTDHIVRKLVHGRIVHGIEEVNSEKELGPTAYFSPKTPIGHVMQYLQEKHDTLSVGIIGLGVGTLSAYNRPNDEMVFFDIDPDIIKVAKKHFNFLSKAKGKVNITLKDGRLALEQSLNKNEPFQFNLLVMDAFSAETVPFHLITKEAIDLYQRHLKDQGIIAINVTNGYVDFQKLIKGLADHMQCPGLLLSNFNDLEYFTAASEWAFLSCDANLDKWLKAHSSKLMRRDLDTSSILWTDQKNTILPLLRRN